MFKRPKPPMCCKNCVFSTFSRSPSWPKVKSGDFCGEYIPRKKGEFDVKQDEVMACHRNPPTGSN